MYAYQEDLDDLEELIGPIRLLITAEESGEVILSHRFEEHDTMDTEALEGTSRQIHVEIFDKQRVYTVVIDRGSTENMNQLNEEYWKSIIIPVIGRIIQKKEHILFLWALDNMATVELAETAIIHPGSYYRTFVSRVFADKIYSEHPELSSAENELSVDVCLKAIDICRHFILQSRTENKLLPGNLPEIIDQIL